MTCKEIAHECAGTPLAEVPNEPALAIRVGEDGPDVPSPEVHGAAGPPEGYRVGVVDESRQEREAPFAGIEERLPARRWQRIVFPRKEHRVPALPRRPKTLAAEPEGLAHKDRRQYECARRHHQDGD